MLRASRILILAGVFLAVIALLIACSNLPDLPTRTPQAAAPVEATTDEEAAEESIAAAEVKEEEAEETAVDEDAEEETAEAQPISAPAGDSGAAAKAVDLIGAWVDGGAPEADAFDYEGMDGNTYQGTFEVDILPLFTVKDVWYEGSRACDSCHFANSEASNHEMNLGSYEGIMAGGDVLSEPPGVPILGHSEIGATDYDWSHAKLRERLRNNRMPPGIEFDATEENRDGYCVSVSDDGVEVQPGEYGCELYAVGLLGAWVEANAPESDAFEYDGAQLTFERDVLPFFTEHSMWFDGSQACTGCHFGNTENSYHEMDLSTYEGIMAGGDVLSEPPGVPILGQSELGADDFDWSASKLRARLRNNRMSPGWEFDITEENRDGPYVLHGEPVDMDAPAAVAGQTTESVANFGTPTSTTTIKTTIITAADGTTTTTTETIIAHYGELAAAAMAGADDCAIYAVDLIGNWVDAGAPEMASFDYTSVNDEACSGSFESDILPLFTENNMWFDGSQACTGCHFANSENSYHEMDLSSYEGIMAGGDVLSEPPGVPILGQSELGASDFDWAHSKLRERLRNNRMPPGWEFDITEENRDGPALTINGVEVRAVDLVADWVDSGAPETDPFGDYNGTFEGDVLPLFSEEGAWFEGSQACTGCHFGNTENSYHEMDLSSYEGIMAGGDVLSEPPGVPILGQSELGASDYDWEHSKMRERLRNNRMPPGIEFDITEENRDGPVVLAGTKQ